MKILSHARLKITFQELGALMGTHALLKHGVLEWHPEVKSTRAANRGVHVFNMGTVLDNGYHCGSVGCIGGNMAAFMGAYPDDYVSMSQSRPGGSPILHDLFFPPGKYDYDTITAKQAVKVIELFLATGKVQWEKVLTKRNLEPDE